MVEAGLYQLAIEQTRDYALFLLDTDGRVLTWNTGAARIKGYSPDDIIGRHFSTFYTREALERDWPAYELERAGIEGSFEDEGWRVRKDGSQFWASVIITALRDIDGKLLGYSKITRDLTERRRSEEALMQSEERFRLLIEGVVDYAIFMLDPDGVVTSWNSGAERIKGYSRSEILGRHFSRFYSAEDVQAGKPSQELALARSTGRAENEGWRVKKDGERFWARVVVTALYGDGGELRGYAKVTQDLTERRHTRALEKAAQNVNEFIAVLAHELRNPLAPIRAAVQVIAQTPPGHPGREALYKTIDRQSAQLARIVDDMLDISRITRGELAVERAAADVNAIARAAAEAAAPGIEAGKHRFDMRLEPGPVLVDADAARLTQLVSNLLNNAARYTPDGGAITLDVQAGGNEVVVRVRDTGRGIAPEWQERIFDMFVQGRPVLERVGGGLGIGLALSRRIAELHGGSLQARSEGEHKGSEFILRLPLMALPTGPQAHPSGAHRVDVAAVPRRVLIVDDNVDAAQALELLLNSIGHQTAVAHHGAQALEALPVFRPDAVLLDIGLPDMDGYEVARRMRASAAGPSLRIIAVSGWGQEADKQRSREAGFDVHLVKPVDLDDLEAALDPAPQP